MFSCGLTLRLIMTGVHWANREYVLLSLHPDCKMKEEGRKEIRTGRSVSYLDNSPGGNSNPESLWSGNSTS